MKTRFIFISLILILLNSCIVKSLHPFYTRNSIHFEKRFIGIWDDGQNNICEVFSFKEKFLEDRKIQLASELSEEDFIEYTRYENGYYVRLTEGDKEAIFSVIPFKIKDQLFLDFTPYEIDMDEINNLAQNHLMGMHTLVKMEFSDDHAMVNLKWFGEEKLIELINDDKIRIRYEKIGHNYNGYLLTASSEELQTFIKKYMNSNDENKWATEIEYNFIN